jgi:hypothetical protein
MSQEVFVDHKPKNERSTAGFRFIQSWKKGLLQASLPLPAAPPDITIKDKRNSSQTFVMSSLYLRYIFVIFEAACRSVGEIHLMIHVVNCSAITSAITCDKREIYLICGLCRKTKPALPYFQTLPGFPT